MSDCFYVLVIVYSSSAVCMVLDKTDAINKQYNTSV